MLDADGIDGWRINYFCAEVTELHCLDVAQLGNNVGRADDARVCSHEAVHVGPYLQHTGIQGRSYDAGSIVAAASTEVRHLAALGIGTYEATDDADLGHLLPGLTDKLVGQFADQTILACLELCLDELAAVEPFSAVNQCGNDAAADAFAVGDDGCLGLGAQVMDEVDTLIDAAQFLQQLAHLCQEAIAFLTRRQDGTNHLFVPDGYLLERLLVELVAVHSHLPCTNELVCDAAKGTDHDDDRFFLPFYNPFYA